VLLQFCKKFQISYVKVLLFDVSPHIKYEDVTSQGLGIY